MVIAPCTCTFRSSSLILSARYLSRHVASPATSSAPLHQSSPGVKAPTSTSGLANPALAKLIRHSFPRSEYCFAYGSKILHQQDHVIGSDTMTDVIFVVKDSTAWHRENLERNPDHYFMPLRLLGAGVISLVQEKFGGKCLFNPYVEVNGYLLKYGVISKADLLSDLEHWDTLYIAGRLHKPVLLLHREPSFPTSYIKLNLRSALHTALLLLPERFDDTALFTVISNLSYHGDIRFYVRAENVNKVRNIVTPNIPHFRELYRHVITESPFLEETDYGYVQRAKTVKRTSDMERYLPRKLLYIPEGKISFRSRRMAFDRNEDPKDQLLRKTAAGDTRFLEEVLRKTVMMTSFVQPLKGILTTPPTKSLRYAISKFRKARGSGSATSGTATRMKEEFRVLEAAKKGSDGSGMDVETERRIATRSSSRVSALYLMFMVVSLGVFMMEFSDENPIKSKVMESLALFGIDPSIISKKSGGDSKVPKSSD